MKHKLLNIFIVVISFFVAQSAYAQSKTIEERLNDLEKRVQALEAKIGTTTSPSSNISPSNKTQTTQITEDIIKAAIKEQLKREVPATWAGSLMGGKNANVERIDIQQIGNYNDQGKYWPVKCRVKGTSDADFLFETKKTSFDKIGDFKIRQDDYGKWYSELDTF